MAHLLQMASIDAIGCGSPQDAAAALTAAIANTQKAASNGSLVRLTSDLRRAESAEVCHAARICSFYRVYF